jgi:hypothetical protein
MKTIEFEDWEVQFLINLCVVSVLSNAQIDVAKIETITDKLVCSLKQKEAEGDE